MDIFNRVMGHSDAPPGTELVGNAALENPPCYLMLFPEAFDLNADAIALALQSFHEETQQARVEMEFVPSEKSPSEEWGIIGLVGWGKHVCKLLGFQTPVPEVTLEACVAPSHIHPQLKVDAAQHKSHLLLYYAGYEEDPLEQYVALTVLAVALARFDALLLLNEPARTAFPSEALLAEEANQDRLQSLRELPIPLLYGGFVKLEVENIPGVWMRTYGNHMLDLPDLAIHVESHARESVIFDLFANMLAYLRNTGKEFAPGHTMQVGETTYLRLREPTDQEWFLDSPSELFVADTITADEINVE